ncbi:MAG TPA: AraC family transcriptional regulator [Acetobacteraceae bacterium]|nr:AraC family transcriptional regulator [Acetobacteraceae bacterium]
MTLSARTLAAGPGWEVADVVCTAGPRDKPFEEQHEAVSIAAVTTGSFVYRSARGTALLGPGAVLLGNPGECFECGHEHGVGDRCIAFSFQPAFFDALLSDVPGAARGLFAAPGLPASEAMTGLLASLEAARDEADADALEELALRVAAAAAMGGAKPAAAGNPHPRDLRRVGEVIRLIEERLDDNLGLGVLAVRAAMSPYHFLRTFRAVAGMTPHQYVLRLQLHRAAVRLRRTREAVSAIAFDAGFGDLSTFNRRFRRVMGMSPLRYRGAP